MVELFAGIGAYSKALENLIIDHEVVCAVEHDKKTMQSYNIIHSTNFEVKDITKIDVNEVPDCDIIFYSPPCQSFSVAGKQEGFEDQRGTLFFDALNIIKHKKPKYAIMENVRGLTQKKFKFEFETMLQLLDQEGYKNYWKVLNSKEYGIPQNRERVFIVSIRKDIEQEFEFPKSFDNGLRLKDMLEDEVDEKYYISDENSELLFNEFKSEFVEKGVYPCLTPSRINKRQNGRRFKENDEPSFTVNTQDRHGILEFVDEYEIENKNESYLRKQIKDFMKKSRPNTDIGIKFKENGDIRPHQLDVKKSGISELAINHEDNISNTVLASHMPKVYRKIDYRIRKLTPLECLRLMGFEDADYIKLKNNKISNSQIYKMAGNSIVVDTIEAILENLLVNPKIHSFAES